MGNFKVITMKSIIYFAVFNLINYISSKSHSKVTYPSNGCTIKLIDDDSSPDNHVANYKIAIPNLWYDLEDDVKEIYVANNLSSSSYRNYKCEYEVKACKDNNYKNCVTFTGSLTTGQVRGLRALHGYGSYFDGMDSVVGWSRVVAPPAPPAPKPAPKPKPEPKSEPNNDADDSLERQTNMKFRRDDDMERQTNSRKSRKIRKRRGDDDMERNTRKFRKSRKARKN